VEGVQYASERREILEGKSAGKRPLGSPRRRLVLEKYNEEYGLDLSGSGLRPVAGSS
jgi:hypothetical protein